MEILRIEKTTLKITIDKQGNVSYQVQGLKGKDCIKATEFLDKDLGEVTNREYTREYYESKVETTRRVETRR